jgi:hypothetical protein
VNDMKKPFAKQLIMGTMALTLIGGAGALITQNTFAATSVTPSTYSASTTAAPTAAVAPQKEHQSFDVLREVNDQLLTFLKLDKATFKTKLATETLAQIAADQGISRDALKTELTAEVNAQLDKEKADFAQNIDQTVDSTQIGKFGNHGEKRGKNHEGAKLDLSATATLLGLSSPADLKAALVSGKSIADLAAEKGVPVQSVIDLQVTQIVKNLDQKLADNKITQVEYDKQKANITKIATKIVNDKEDGSKQGNKKNKQDDNNKLNDTEVNDDAIQPSAPTAPSTSSTPSTPSTPSTN